MHVSTETEGDAIIPVSSGIPSAVRVSAVIGLICIFIMGGLVISQSNANHIWPSSASTKIDLNPK